MGPTQENKLSSQNTSDKKPVTYCDQLPMPIENRILTLRGKQVMIDRDLAELYGVETKRLNEQVKRNVERFPEHFRFQLSNQEKDELVANCDRFRGLKHSSVNPFAFTEQGVAMLSAVLKSDTAIYTSIRIIDAFVAMRNFLMNNASIFQRIDRIEMKQLKTDEKVDAILDRLNNAQYLGVTLHPYNKAHDRFLIIDEDVYHIGHSLKDLGKKLFAFSKMDVMTGTELISQL